jgi:arylsulfatase A-like enzyme
VWSFWDFPPTAAEIAGTTMPGKIDRISMLPALLGRKQDNHEFLYWEFHERGLTQAVRMGDWKAVRSRKKPQLELYNLKHDLSEQHDIAQRHPDIVAKIEAYLQTARTQSPHWG